MDKRSAIALLILFYSALVVTALAIGQKPVEYLPCEKYGMKEAKIILIDADKVTFVCGEIK